jgi:hypothetical protein
MTSGVYEHHRKPVEYIVNEETGCHICISHSGKEKGSYPRIWQKNKPLILSRYLWERHIGQIPKNLYVCHTCDNKLCIKWEQTQVQKELKCPCNDKMCSVSEEQKSLNDKCKIHGHLFLGTGKDNMQDCIKKGRYVSNFGDINLKQKGENNPSSKLTNKEVEKIRDLLKSKIPQQKIAAMFGISQAMVSFIKLGKKWPI